MTQFDEILRRGLMDANLAQYETVLQHANDMQPDFSPHYLRERTRMLADPWGWVRRWSGRKRLDWRLIAIVAALLLLSACAYAVATGQFSQWFPRLGVDPAAPDETEEVLSRTGTVIEQSQTVGNATVTLNAALWDGSDVWLSFDIEGIDIPEDVQQYYPLWSVDCRLILREDQMKEYAENRAKQIYAEQGIEPTPEQLEADIQAWMEDPYDGMALFPDEVEERKLTFQDNESLVSDWFTETKRPELTLHLENIAPAIYGEDGYPTPGEVFIEGPFDLTFTLDEPILPVRYDGACVDITGTDYDGVERSFRVTGFEFSVTGLTVFYEPPQLDETLSPDEQFKIDSSTLLAVGRSIQGVWTEEEKYVDLSLMGSGGSGGTADCNYPYPIDPATVTAVEIGGVRMELSELERITE